MYEKEILQLTSRKFNNFVLQNCVDWHESINCAQIEFDNPNELSQKNFLVHDNNHKNYKQYIENSLVASGIAGEMGSKQIIDDIKYYYQIN